MEIVIYSCVGTIVLLVLELLCYWSGSRTDPCAGNGPRAGLRQFARDPEALRLPSVLFPAGGLRLQPCNTPE